MNTVFLESPFGTVRFTFHSETSCVANLWEAPNLIVNKVAVEGLLQFRRISYTWQWQRTESNLDRKDNGKAVSEAIRDKLVRTLTDHLNEWCRDNPKSFKAVKVALIETNLKEAEAELQRLTVRMTAQQIFIDDLKQQLTALK